LSNKPLFSVKVEPGDIEDPIQQLRNHTRLIQDSVKYQIQIQKSTAKIIRARYDAFRKEGFNDQQALFLCKDGR
jgi:hypothetical protein